MRPEILQLHGLLSLTSTESRAEVKECMEHIRAYLSDKSEETRILTLSLLASEVINEAEGK